MVLQSIAEALANSLQSLSKSLKTYAGTTPDALKNSIQTFFKNSPTAKLNVDVDVDLVKKFDNVLENPDWLTKFDDFLNTDLINKSYKEKFDRLLTVYAVTAKQSTNDTLAIEKLNKITDAFNQIVTKHKNYEIKPEERLKTLKDGFLDADLDATSDATTKYKDLFANTELVLDGRGNRKNSIYPPTLEDLKQLQTFYQLQEKIGPMLAKDYARQAPEAIKTIDETKLKLLLNYTKQTPVDPAYTLLVTKANILEKFLLTSTTGVDHLFRNRLITNIVAIANNPTLVNAAVDALGDSNLSEALRKAIVLEFEAIQKTIPMVKEMSKKVWNAVPASTWASLKECATGKGPKACLVAFAKLVGVLVTIAVPIALGKCYGGDGKGRDGKVFGECQDGAYDDCKYHCFDKYKDGFDDTDTTYPRKNWSFVVDEQRDATFAPSNALWKEAIMTPIPPRDEDLGRNLSVWERMDDIEKSRELYCTVNNLQTWRAENYQDRIDKGCTDYCQDVCGKEFPANDFFDKLGESLEDLTKPVAVVGEVVAKITVGTAGKITGAAGGGLFDGLGWFGVALVVGLIAYLVLQKMM